MRPAPPQAAPPVGREAERDRICDGTAAPEMLLKELGGWANPDDSAYRAAAENLSAYYSCAALQQRNPEVCKTLQALPWLKDDYHPWEACASNYFTTLMVKSMTDGDGNAPDLCRQAISRANLAAPGVNAFPKDAEDGLPNTADPPRGKTIDRICAAILSSGPRAGSRQACSDKGLAGLLNVTVDKCRQIMTFLDEDTRGCRPHSSHLYCQEHCRTDVSLIQAFRHGGSSECAAVPMCQALISGVQGPCAAYSREASRRYCLDLRSRGRPAVRLAIEEAR